MKHILKYICKTCSIHHILLVFMLIFTLLPALLGYWCLRSFTINIIGDKYLTGYISSLSSHISYSFEEFEDSINTSYLALSLYPGTIDSIEKRQNVEEILYGAFENEKLITYAELVMPDKVYTYSANGKIPEFYADISPDFINTFSNMGTNIMEGVISDDNTAYIVTGRRIYNYYSDKDLGYILFYTNEEYINRFYNRLKNPGDTIFITLNDCIISHDDKAALGKSLWIAGSDSAESEDTLSKTSVQKINIGKAFNGSLDITVSASYTETFAIIDFLNKINLFLLFGSFIIIFIVSMIISQRCLATIRELNTDILAFADDPENYIPKSKPNEVASLEAHFNEMTVKIRELIAKNELEREKKHIAELCMLQAQIKHHFVYNALDIVFWKAHSSNQQEIEKLVLALSSFFRISLSDGNNFIKVRNEIEHVKNYLTIEKMRFNELFDVEYRISEDILDIYVLKIILQPIVENCIKHGFKDIDYKGKIQINGYLRDSETLIFEVIDNGNGITSNPLAPSTQSRSDKISYGLSNISERLRFEYGEDSKINFIDTNGNGTHVEVVIKYKNKPETD